MAQLENDFRAGIMPWAGMVKKYGVGVGWIKRTATAYGWTRDLTDKIQEAAAKKARERVAIEARAVINLPDPPKDVETKRLDPQYALTEAEIIDTNSDLIERVNANHQAMIGKARNLLGKMFSEFETANSAAIASPEAIEILAKSGHKDAAAALREACNLPTRVDVVKKLVDTMKTIITTEREILRIGEAAGTGNDLERFLRTLGNGSVIEGEATRAAE